MAEMVASAVFGEPGDAKSKLPAAPLSSVLRSQRSVALERGVSYIRQQAAADPDNVNSAVINVYQCGPARPREQVMQNLVSTILSGKHACCWFPGFLLSLIA